MLMEESSGKSIRKMGIENAFCSETNVEGAPRLGGFDLAILHNHMFSIFYDYFPKSFLTMLPFV